MHYHLQLHVGNDAALFDELAQGIKDAGLDSTPRGVRLRMPLSTSEIIVTLSSAGAFTALYNLIVKLLEKNKERELKIEREGFTVHLKAHSLLEEKELLQQLAPELALGKITKNDG